MGDSSLHCGLLLLGCRWVQSGSRMAEYWLTYYFKQILRFKFLVKVSSTLYLFLDLMVGKELLPGT